MTWPPLLSLPADALDLNGEIKFSSWGPALQHDGTFSSSAPAAFPSHAHIFPSRFCVKNQSSEFPFHRWVFPMQPQTRVYSLPSLISGTTSLKRGNLAYPFPGLGHWCLKGFGDQRQEEKKQTVTSEPSWVSLQSSNQQFGNRKLAFPGIFLVKQREGLVVLNHKWTQKKGVVDKQTQLTDYNSRRKWDSEAYRVSEMMEMQVAGLGGWRCGLKCCCIHEACLAPHPQPR